MTQMKTPLKLSCYFVIAGCSGNIGILAGSNGSFAIEPDQYKATMRCRWKIVVESSKVSHLIYIYIYIYHLFIYLY